MTFKNWLKTSIYKNDNPLSVTTIKCYGERLTNLKGIEDFKNLEELDCSGNELTSLKGIEDFKNLKILYCDYNNLISLKSIQYLTNLKILHCYSNLLEHKDYIDIDFNSVKKYQKYLKSFYRKDRIKNILNT